MGKFHNFLGDNCWNSVAIHVKGRIRIPLSWFNKYLNLLWYFQIGFYHHDPPPDYHREWTLEVTMMITKTTFACFFKFIVTFLYF